VRGAREGGKHRRVERTASDSMAKTAASRRPRRAHERSPAGQNARLRAGIKMPRPRREKVRMAPLSTRLKPPAIPIASLQLTLLGLALGLQLAAHDVRVGAVVVDEVAARIGNVGRETGDEVEGLDGVGLVAVLAGRGQVRGSGRAWRPPQAGEADGVAQAVASEGLEGAAVAGWDGHEVECLVCGTLAER
jgi:hypothetical protein